MGMITSANLVIGLKLTQEDVYDSVVCCERCRKANSSQFCPDCGGKIKKQLLTKPAMQDLIENETLLREQCESTQWYFPLKRYETNTFCTANQSSVSIPINDFFITPEEMAEFEKKAIALGIWQKDKFGVHLFQYISY